MASTICPSSGLLILLDSRAVALALNARAVAFALGLRVGARMNLVEDPFDAVLAGNRVVVEKLQLRHAFEPQPGADLPAQKRHGAVERVGARPAGVLVAEHGVVDARLLNVGAH